jgi:large subunit ribosomal protein L9e
MVQKICSTTEVQVIEGVTVDVKARVVTVKGARGTLTRDFKHLSVEISKDAKGLIKVSKWFGTKKQLAAVRSVVSHISKTKEAPRQGPPGGPGGQGVGRPLVLPYNPRAVVNFPLAGRLGL